MKKLLLLTAVLVASVLSVQASAIQSTCAGASTYGELLALGPAGCQVGDKIFENFGTAPGTTAIPANWQVTLETLPSGEYNVDFAQGSTGSQLSFPAGPWGVQYDIRVDTSFPGASSNYISEVFLNLNAGATGRGLLTKTITNLDSKIGPIGALLGVVSSTGGSAGVVLLPASQWIRVVETVSLSRGTLSSFTDAYTQTSAPEPATYGMIGFGLAALGVFSRRKKA